MQIITEIPDGKPGRPDYQGSRFLKRQPGCDLPKKTEVATGRKPNAFLTGKVPPLRPIITWKAIRMKPKQISRHPRILTSSTGRH